MRKTFNSGAFFCMLVILGIALFSVDFYAGMPEGETLAGMLDDFEKYAQKSMEEWGIPGMAIAIVRGDELIYAGGFGVKKLGGDDRVDEYTIFQIGSTSKAFTAALVAMMAEEKRLDWSDRVIDHLPGFRMYDPWVTREFRVFDVMAQHSGMPGYAGDLQSFFGFDRSHIIDSIRYIEPASSFRSEFAYMNNLFLVAGALIEKVSGKTWEENLQERILNSLGMDSTSYTREAFVDSENVSFLHKNCQGAPEILPMDWPFLEWVYTYGPAGGINSNAVDMAKWVRFQLKKGLWNGKQLLSRESMEYMHFPKTVIKDKVAPGRNYYCTAWVLTEDKGYPAFIWHTGGTSGIKSLIQLVPDLDLGFVFLTNMTDNKLPEALAKRFIDIYTGGPLREWSAEMLQSYRSGLQSRDIEREDGYLESCLPFDAYTGDYYSNVYGKAVLRDEGDKMSLTLGPAEIKLFIHPFKRDTFVLSIPDFEDESGFVQFGLNSEGIARQMYIEAFDDGNIGTFEKIQDTKDPEK